MLEQLLLILPWFSNRVRAVRAAVGAVQNMLPGRRARAAGGGDVWERAPICPCGMHTAVQLAGPSPRVVGRTGIASGMRQKLVV